MSNQVKSNCNYSPWQSCLRRCTVWAPCLLALSGCSGGADALPLPSYDPSAAAAKAMELYDTNGDGFVAGEELDNAPGLKAAMKNLDADKDDQVSEEEVAERVQAWERMRVGVMMFFCEVKLNGKLLSDATVTFEPDEFLGDTLENAVGTTSMGGSTKPRVPKENRPTPTSPPGMQAGIYRVRISKVVDGKETIPAKYNAETVLGQEVSPDDPAISNKQVVYDLSTK